MFKRLLLDEHTVLCLMVAFVTASTIFLAFLWRALHMSRAQVDRFSNLPFGAEAPVRQPDRSPAAAPIDRNSR